MKGKIALLGVAAGVFAASGHHPAALASGQQGKTAAATIAYASKQIGLPYRWGGTGPDAFDCSGLAMEAYAHAGVSIARTSQDQWATEAHVSSPQPGDLVFFAGGDGTASAPGHVGVVTGPHAMIEAYAPGYPVRRSTFGLPSSPPGDENPVGFTDPSAQGRAA